MRTDRLERLVAVLERVDREERPFDMGAWVRSPLMVDSRYHDIPTLDDIKRCGTASCALGWAARDTWHRDRGLRFKWHDGARSWFPSFDGEYGLRAAVAFYEISYDQAADLFDPTSYASLNIAPWRVVNRVNALLAAGRVREGMRHETGQA